MMVFDWPPQCGRLGLAGEGHTLVIDGCGFDLKLLSSQALIDLVFYRLGQLSRPLTTPESVWLTGFALNYLIGVANRADFSNRMMRYVQPQGELCGDKCYKGQICIEAEQFSITGREEVRYPKGMHPWRDEQARPRDMSWGYVNVGIRRVHVQSGDWIVTYPDGSQGVVSEDAFPKFWQSDLAGKLRMKHG